MRGKTVKREFRFHGDLFAPLHYILKTSSKAVVNVADDELEKLWTNITTSIATYGLRLATPGRQPWSRYSLFGVCACASRRARSGANPLRSALLGHT